MLNCCYQQMVIIFVQRVGKLEKPVLKMKKSKISKKKERREDIYKYLQYCIVMLPYKLDGYLSRIL